MPSSFFSSSAFKGFGDDAGGFFGVYNDVFDTIDRLEEAECAGDFNAAPRLGGSSTRWTEGPGLFYAYYESFSTRRAFAWCDKYNPNEAPNRQASPHPNPLGSRGKPGASRDQRL